MKLTKLTVLAATAAFVLNASAKLPSGFESVKIKATILTENGAKVVKTKITNDDILALIDTEYGTSFSKANGGKGYQLVAYGLYEEEFAVLDKNGNVALSDASSDTNEFYSLYIYPYNDDNWVESYKGEKYNYTIPDVSLTYNSSDDEDFFYVDGLMTDKVDWNTYNENYSMKNGQGSISFNDEDVFGPITGSVSGSGKDVYPFDY
ncbi:MAG TPA: hypothetical protein VHY30_01060 [Verrucomicrobiae bacterium]|jgi:hypothetical protein|nr:hypothetical protein [Verrucomicrobiae bacterium]